MDKIKDFKDLLNLISLKPPTQCKHVFVPSIIDPGQFFCKLCKVSTRKYNKE